MKTKWEKVEGKHGFETLWIKHTLEISPTEKSQDLLKVTQRK